MQEQFQFFLRLDKSFFADPPSFLDHAGENAFPADRRPLG